MPPIAVESETEKLLFCCDNLADTLGVSIPFPLDGNTGLIQPLVANFQDIPSGETRSGTFSLRFSRPETAGFTEASDVLQAFAKSHPLEFKWTDRRPIGMVFLASLGVLGKQHEKNPNRWIVVNQGDHDMSTPAGRAQFRAGVLQWADNTIKVLQDTDAQGMITWDVEGQGNGPVYFGEPHQIGELAPEMEELVETEVLKDGKTRQVQLPLIDAYFRRFTDAGLRVGVCLRPQKLSRDAQGLLVQVPTDAEESYQDLRRNLAYAHKPWGCTLFYVDTTVIEKPGIGFGQPVPAEIFARLQREFPDVLLMPENQTLSYYTCTAPLDSFIHHGVARTAPRIREVWPDAFSVLMMGSELGPHEAALVDGVRRGDILLFNAWYPNETQAQVIRIYNKAGKTLNAHP